MFNRIISTLLLGLCANSVSAYEPNIPVHPLSVNANGSSWLCSDCGSPYTSQGLQNFAVRAHNLAWGASKQKIVLNPSAVNGRRFYVGSGSWHDLRITNGVDTVSVSFKASATDSFLMMIGGKVGAALTLQLEFGNGHVEFVNVIYRPGHDYIIVPVVAGGGSSSLSGSGAGFSTGSFAGSSSSLWNQSLAWQLAVLREVNIITESCGFSCPKQNTSGPGTIITTQSL